MTRPNRFARRAAAPTPAQQLRPAGQAAPENTGTGENLCPRCHGTGRVVNAQREDVPCPACEGTGQLLVGIGGA